MNGTVLTGYDLIDNDFGGLKPSEVTLIGGRPSMGKTSLVLQIALNAAIDGNKVLFFTTENSPVELELRLASIISNIPRSKIQNWDLTDEEWNKFKETMKEIRLLSLRFVYASDLLRIQYWSEKMVEEQEVDLIIFDYLQMIRNIPTKATEPTPKYTPFKELKRFKKMAKKYHVPVVVLTQLDRKLEKRKDKHPKIRDIRVDNLSEEAYDQVFFIYRDSYYDLEASVNKAEIIGRCKKNNLKKKSDLIWDNRKCSFFEKEN